MTLVDLSPCPFCGGYAEFERMGARNHSCIVACQDCGCRLESNEAWPNSGKQWNTRVIPHREAHKVMTPEEYASMLLKGWHEVCRDVDGFGGTGVRFLGQ